MYVCIHTHAHVYIVWELLLESGMVGCCLSVYVYEYTSICIYVYIYIIIPRIMCEHPRIHARASNKPETETMMSAKPVAQVVLYTTAWEWVSPPETVHHAFVAWTHVLEQTLN
jgi:hypothetical protein